MDKFSLRQEFLKVKRGMLDGLRDMKNVPDSEKSMLEREIYALSQIFEDLYSLK